MEIRCSSCDKLLAKGDVNDIEIKCPRCGAYNHLRATSPTPESRRAPGKDGSYEKEAAAAAARKPRTAAKQSLS